MESYLGRYEAYKDSSHRVTVSWRRKPGAIIREKLSYDLNLAHLENMVSLGGGDPIVELASSIGKIQKDGLKIKARKMDFAVNMHDRRDRKEERCRIEEQRAALSRSRKQTDADPQS